MNTALPPWGRLVGAPTLFLVLVLAGTFGTAVGAQEKPVYGPEVTSILGDPNRPSTGLDADAVAFLGQPAGPKPSESAVSGQAAEIASKLRCPVCQGVSIADSPSGMATNMRGQVRDLVGKGYSEDQVMNYFERSYGEFVRLEPPLRGLNWMLWLLPSVVLLGGAWFVYRRAREPLAPAAVATTEVQPADADADPALAKYLDRIRRDSGTST